MDEKTSFKKVKILNKINNTQSGKGYLFRVSASEICNYNCAFCHPNINDRVKIIKDEEFLTVFKTMDSLYKLKTLHFTGGEPLMRSSLSEIIAECREFSGDDLDIAITTNASMFDKKLKSLLDAGLSRANISLHSLDKKKYREFTGSSYSVEEICNNIENAKKSGLKIKINSVVIRDFNDMDIIELANYCFQQDIIPRFLELGIYGPVSQWFSAKDQVHHAEIFNKMQDAYGPFERDYTHRGNGPSKYYKNSTGQVFGILDNQSDVLCRGCDRFRMSANGFIKVCNFKPIDLKPFLGDDAKLKEKLLLLGDVLNSRGYDYIGKRIHRNDYNFRWNHPESNNY